MEEDKKTERKRKRFAARLKISKGIICTDIPGPNIVLCNAGQATGLEKEFILNLTSLLGIPVPKYIAEKGESHSFLVFKNAENAELFFNKYNAKAKIDENGNQLYMHYVENVPNLETVIPDPNPQGLILLNNFITDDEEILFLKIFDWTQEDESSVLKNRQVRHYGYEFRYGSNDVDLNNPLEEKIPEVCDTLWRRLREYGIDVGIPDQMTVNKYLPGQGIPSHVDKHSPFGDTILSLSLRSAVVMDWKHHTGKWVPVLIEARSLLIMQDKARYDWQHGIQPRTYDPVIEQRTMDNKNVKIITSETVPRQTRISLTFRWTRSGPCQCGYKTLCDSVGEASGDDLEDQIASNLEELHVHQVYEQIAGHFSTTRHKPWPKVVEFTKQVPPGAVLRPIYMMPFSYHASQLLLQFNCMQQARNLYRLNGPLLDLGCGNGKNILSRNDVFQIAGERSSGLLLECKENIQRASAAECVRLDLLHTCLKDSCADVILCIAVIHHFSSRARRLQSVSTIHRLLRTNGQALITVWAKDQTKSNYLLKTKNPNTDGRQITVAGLNLPVHENRTQFQHKDLLVPWKLRRKTDNKLADQPESTLLRYYHVFEEGELDGLCEEVGMKVESSFYEEGNWCVVCKKV